MIKKKNFLKRIFTAVLGGGLLIFSSLNQWSFLAIFILIIYFSSTEYYRILKKNKSNPNNFLGIFLSILIFVSTFIYASFGSQWLIYFLLIPIFPLICLSALYTKNNTESLSNVSLTFFGILYISIPISLLNFIVFDSGIYDNKYLLTSFFFLWTSESAAYIGGSIFGKNKLFESVSPMKSWEGVIFGFISNIILAYFLWKYFNENTYFFWATFSVIVLISGIFGDLFESLIKRNLNLKNSGTRLPGHGGFLDRFDSFFFVIPYVFFYLKIIEHLT